ncbi:hypothetical protein, partial [Mesorhizobium sp. M4A.F.Ca.ET.090.04.2.1]|uniref:hypothetical protein n=1 Tax=Mesorhizobium sp. M4A.F.Ca.ET.090.04.2.1 TaxID=2496663 RepID=UPI001AECB402
GHFALSARPVGEQSPLTPLCNGIAVENSAPLYIAAITASMLAGAIWRYRQRDMIGMSGSLLMVVLGFVVLLLPD